ncbi:hypothetical protein EOD42_17400 [Rhodovarius crocodyli]|uniref:Uncharacterized protein n=1 Tax=Rhodovarius crocodyli TaxID=1979269 RepID=A0A437MCK7_9PROT|nr:TMEM43 family protein [Rhodovarius crocodyli]RVT95358.1 hypothetical protein EOD42_17400 [Rhodovarius crocodyli]
MSGSETGRNPPDEQPVPGPVPGMDADRTSPDGYSPDGRFELPPQYQQPEEPREDSVTVTTSRSWFQRLGSAMIGLVVGVALLLGSCFGIWWNEARAIRTASSLAEGGAAVQQADPARVDPALEGGLIHVTGALNVPGSLTDPEFRVTAPGAAQLRRIVEMYQWREFSQSQTETRVGGGQTTTTTYTYNRTWSDRSIDSAHFNQASTHRNPATMRFQRNTETARSGTIGAYTVGPAVLGELGGAEALRLEPGTFPLAPGARILDNQIYYGLDPSNPQVGDTRVRFEVVRAGEASVVGRQAGGAIEAYSARAGGQVLLVRRGNVPAAEMFRAAESASNGLAWVLRLVFAVVMYFGFALILNPLKVLADVAPPLGALIGFGTMAIAGLLTFLVAPLAIAIAWFAVRPVLAGIILAGGLALAFGLSRLMRKRRAAAVTPA